MMRQLLTLLSSACAALAGWLRWRRKAAATARQEVISKAVHGGDQEAATRIHHDLLRLALLLLFPLAGCAKPPPSVIYVNQPMAPVRLVHEGTPGWWLSDALYEATLLKLDQLQTERNNE